MSVDMETVRRTVVSALEDGMEAEVSAVDTAAGHGITTPAPEVYIDHEIVDESAVVWPVCLVMPRRSPLQGSAQLQGHVERRYELDIEIWVADSDQTILTVWVERLARAATLVLERASTWAGSGIYNPQATDVLFSDILPDESGYLRACRVVFRVDGIEEYGT
ncbi:MAG: hypothetical protein ACOC9Y_05010 [Chloroflexota bacterium]